MADLEATLASRDYVEILVEELRSSKEYSPIALQKLKKTLERKKDKGELTVQKAQEIKEKWLEKQNVTLVNYASEAYLNLRGISAFLKSREASTQDNSFGQELTHFTLKVLARSQKGGKVPSKNHPEIKTKEALHSFLSEVSQRMPGNEEVVEELKKSLDSLLNSEEVSKQTFLIGREVFNQLVTNWWRRYVGRPELVPQNPEDVGKKDEQLIQPASGDKKLQEDGYFTLGFEVLSFGKVWDKSISTVYAHLRHAIWGRRDENNNQLSGGEAAPLPLRPESGYTAIFVPMHNSYEAFKIHIPLSELEKDYQRFKAFVIQRIFDVYEVERGIIGMSEEVKGNKGRIIERVNTEKYAKYRFFGAFKNLYHSREVQDAIFDLNDFSAADVRIAVNDLGSKANLSYVQDSIHYDPMGVRIPTTYVLWMKNDVIRKIHTTNSHPFIDGQSAKEEQEKIIKMALFGDEDNNLEYDRDKRKKAQVFKPIKDSDLEKLEGVQSEPPERKEKNPETITLTKEMGELESAKDPDIEGGYSTSVITLGKDRNNPSENVPKQLFDTLKKNKKDGVYSYFKEKHGISLTPAVILNFALMRALKLQHSHFLDKDREDGTVGPVIFPCHPIFEILERKKGEYQAPLTQVDIQTVIENFKILENGRKQFWGNSEEFTLGAAPAEVLDTLSGGLKRPLSGLGTALSRQENELLQKTVLVSILLDPTERQENFYGDKHFLEQDGVRFREFTTAIGEPYALLGAIGICQNSKDGIRISYRRGERNLLEELYGAGEDGLVAFKNEVSKQIKEILYLFETIQKQETTANQKLVV